MAFGLMNTRRYALLYSFLASLFMNCVSVNWTMWSVLTISLFMLTLTDFMFFQVHRLVVPDRVGRWWRGGALLSQAASLRPGNCGSLLAPLPAPIAPPCCPLAGRLFRPLCSSSLADAAVLVAQDNEFCDA